MQVLFPGDSQIDVASGRWLHSGAWSSQILPSIFSLLSFGVWEFRILSSKFSGVLAPLRMRLDWSHSSVLANKQWWQWQVWPGFSTLLNFTEATMLLAISKVSAMGMFLSHPKSQHFLCRSFQSGETQSLAWKVSITSAWPSEQHETAWNCYYLLSPCLKTPQESGSKGTQWCAIKSTIAWVGISMGIRET